MAVYPTSVLVAVDFTHNPFDTGFLWVDISPYVTGRVTFEFGRSNVTGTFQPSQGTLTLDNTDGRFDPSNTSSPYYPNLVARKRIRIQVVLAGTTYTMAWGFVEGWPPRQDGRTKSFVNLTFSDTSGLFSQMQLPDSAWDWQVQNTAPFLWYKLGDTATPKATDSSTSGLPGEWRVFEGAGSPLTGVFMPAPVRQHGEADSVIPAATRKSVSWARMQSEAGQPLGGIVGTPRTPVFVPAWDTQTLPRSGNFTASAWVLYRQAYPVSANSVYASTVPMNQPLFNWGLPRVTAWTLFLDTLGKLTWNFAISPAVTLGVPNIGPSLDDGLPHLIVATLSGTTLTTYVDGVPYTPINVTSVMPAPIYPCVVGYANTDPTGLQSTINDVAFWSHALSGSQIGLLAWAGKYGSTDGSTNVLTTDISFSQGFDLANIQTLTGLRFSGGLKIAGTLGGLTLGDYFAKVAASEQGLLYVADDGTVTFLGRSWPTQTTSANVQWTLTDDATAGLGYSDMTFRDFATDVLNDATVTYPGGSARAVNAASVAKFGTVSGSIDTLLADPLDAQQVANFRAWRFGTPPVGGVMPDTITIYPNTVAEWGMVTLVGITDRLHIIRTRPDGSQIVGDYWVQKIRHDFDASQGGEWSTKLGLMPADHPAKPFVLDVSLLDSTDVYWI